MRDSEMAIYDVALALKQIIQKIERDSKYDVRISKSRVEFISKELSFLGPFLKVMRLLPDHAAVDLVMERGVSNALFKLVSLIIDQANENSTLLLSQQLPRIKQEISSFSEMLKTTEEYQRREQQSSCNFASATCDFIGKKRMVGLHDQLNQLKDLVLEELYEKNRLIVVTGMTGIGKTALVQEIYKDPLVAEQFEAFLFLQFGPRYELKEILLLALHQLGVKFSENDSVEQLQDYVKEFLSRRRYLVVFDDVWNDDSGFLRLRENILPGDKMSSCILVTTQKAKIVSYERARIDVRFLNDEESWNLLREMVVFTTEQEWCNGRQLERVGRKIAKKCEGLPLAIIQVGEILSKTNKTVQEWERIEEKEDPISVTTEDNTPLSNALSLSYDMLPQHLKVCFLYMGVFPKDYKISHSKLIQLWVAEGIVQQTRPPNYLEATPRQHLDQLISHSCVLNMELRSIHQWETKTCRLHFTFRSLCVSIAKREKLFHVVKKYADCFPENLDSQQHRLCIHNNVVLGFEQARQWLALAPEVCSLLCYGPKQKYPIVLYLPFRLLKVLDVLAIRFYEFPEQVLDLFELKYLAITCDGELPPSISRLQNLEVLIFQPYHNIVKSYISYLPIEIWKLHKLAHLHCMSFDLPDPSSINKSLILGALLTLSGVSPHSCTRGVLARMPKLTTLRFKIDSGERAFSSQGDFTSLNLNIFESFKHIIMYPNLLKSVDRAFSSMGDFTSLKSNHIFESCKSIFLYPNLVRSQVIPLIPRFPNSIRKITLGGCGYPWEYMRVIAALPCLQVLKLRCYAFCGPDWKTTGEQFPKLEYLLLEDLDIEHWAVTYSNFRRLRHIVIRHCYKLQEIPPEFKYKLLIEVENCNLSLVKQIQDWQLNHGRHQFLVTLDGWDDEDHKNSTKT